MEIARVIGTVVATRKDETLVGKKLLLVQPLDHKFLKRGNSKVVVDTVGAGIGEMIVCVTGAAARNAVNKAQAAIDSAAIGIIDSVEVEEAWLCPDEKKEEEQ